MRKLALIWGLDGTILDNDKVLFDQARKVCAFYGTALSQSDFFETTHTFPMPDGNGQWATVETRLHGGSDKSLYYWLASKNARVANHVEPEEWISRMASAYAELHDKATLRPHVSAALRALQAAGVPQGLATNASPARVRHALGLLGPAAEALSFVSYGDAYALPKPLPNVYAGALELANQAVLARYGETGLAHVVAIEDSPVGVEAALRAGIPTLQFLAGGRAPTPLPGAPAPLRAVRSIQEALQILSTYVDSD